jgi:hypothetical protein
LIPNNSADGGIVWDSSTNFLRQKAIIKYNIDIMPRKSKKEDGEVNLHIVKNDSDEENAEESASSTEETSILFLKNQTRSNHFEEIENDTIKDDKGDTEDNEDADLSKKRRLSIILRIAVFLLVAVAFGFGLKLANRNGYTECLSDNGAETGVCGVDLKNIKDGLAVDKVRLTDAASIIAAIQKYSAEKKNLPEKLTALLSGGYISKEYSDPEFDKPYFYSRQSSSSYSFCVYLSTGVWGINASVCPSKENYLSNLPGEAPVVSTPMKTVTVQETSIGWLNIRQSATTDSAVIAKAYAGEQYKVLEEKGDWVRIPLKSSVLVSGEQVIEGWVYKSYIK